jgi:hypothetical protein
MSKYDRQLFKYFKAVEKKVSNKPLLLGGFSGPSGGIPPAGVIGMLPQTKVAYDTTEAAMSGTSVSGSLLDNMNHIRYRIVGLEDVIDTIVSSGGVGHTIWWEDLEFPQRTKLRFLGSGVMIEDNVPNLSTDITVLASGGDFFVFANSDLLSDAAWNAKGDLVVGLGTSLAGILPVGVPGQVLGIDPTSAYGIGWIYGLGWGGGMIVQEVDGSPLVSGVGNIIFPNGSVTDNLDGSVTITFSGGSSGVDNFLDLTDTPDSYVSQSGRLVSVKGDESGLEFITSSSLGVDFSKILRFDYGGTVVGQYAFTEAGLDAAIAASVLGDIIQLPLGTLTITAAKTIGAGITLRGTSREHSIIDATGNITTILNVVGTTGSISEEALVENFTMNYTYTGTAGAYLIQLYYAAARNWTVNVTSSTNTSPIYAVFITASKYEKHPVMDVTINITGLRGATGAYVFFPNSSNPFATYSNLIATATTTYTGQCATYGIYTTSYGSYNGTATFSNCMGVAYTVSVCTDNYMGAKGIYHDSYGKTVYSSCIGTAQSSAVGTSYAAGYEVSGSVTLMSCKGLGAIFGGVNGGKIAGLKNGYQSYIIGGLYTTSFTYVAGSTATSIGFWSTGDGTTCIGAKFDADSGAAYYAPVKYDIYADADYSYQLGLYGCQYSTYYSGDPPDTDPVHLDGDLANYVQEDGVAEGGIVTTFNFTGNLDLSVTGDIATISGVATDTSNFVTLSGEQYITDKKFGIPGHYITINASGHMTMVGNARPWRDQIGDAVSLQQSGTEVSRNTTEASVEYTILSNLSDFVYTNIQLNHDKDLTCSLYPHIHWWQAEDNTPNWLLRYRWQINGGTKTTEWTDLACNKNAFTYINGTLNQISYSDPIPVPSGSIISDVVQFKISRDNAPNSAVFSGVADPYTATVAMTNFDVHFMIDSLGSDDEYIK